MRSPMRPQRKRGRVKRPSFTLFSLPATETQMKMARPFTLSMGTAPQDRPSELWSRLSPMTKT